MNNMKNMKKTLAVIGLAYTTQAATVVHTVTINPTLTDWSVTNRVPQFDARLGKLRSVQVTVDANTEPTARVIFAQVIQRREFQLAVTNSAWVAAGGLTASSVLNGAYTNVAVSNTTNVISFPTVLSGAASTNRNLSAWIGTNTVPVITSATTRAWYGGPNPANLNWTTSASAVATVSYTFDGRCEDEDKDSDKDKDGR
jgi:hypothetical protein